MSVYFIGTFAVISLMVGQVVNRGYQSHVGQKVLTEGNETFTPGVHGIPGSSNLTLDPQIEPLVHTDGYANPVKLGYALSLTFVVGAVQVSVRFVELLL